MLVHDAAQRFPQVISENRKGCYNMKKAICMGLVLVLFAGMMPFAWAMDKIVPRASVLKTWIGAGRKRLGSGNVQYQEEYRK